MERLCQDYDVGVASKYTREMRAVIRRSHFMHANVSMQKELDKRKSLERLKARQLCVGKISWSRLCFSFANSEEFI